MTVPRVEGPPVGLVVTFDFKKNEKVCVVSGKRGLANLIPWLPGPGSFFLFSARQSTTRK